MRFLLATASLIALILAIGCNHAPHRRDSVAGEGPANVATPTVDSLIDYLNNNAARVKPDLAVTSVNVLLDIKAEGSPQIGINARMLCQSPLNFRMSGVAIGNQPVVELGSNDKEFWFWCREVKVNSTPYLFHCSYTDLARGAKMPFPFQPDMVVKALGLAPYDRGKNYTVKIVNDNRGRPKAIELTEKAQSPENKPIEKITVFNYQQADPQVLAHVLKDERGKVVCEANIRFAQHVGGSEGPIIPRMVDFNWPEQKMKMKMRIENPSLTAMPPQKAATVFNRQGLTWQSFDLATGTVDGPGVQQAGGASMISRP